MWINATSGRLVQGGSTLTQQLVKNFYLTNERTLVRKATEAMMAVLLELHYDKREILEAYMNETVPLAEISNALQQVRDSTTAGKILLAMSDQK